MFMRGNTSFSKFYIFAFNLIKIITIVFIFRMSLLMFQNAEHFGGRLWLCAIFEIVFLAAIYFIARCTELACKPRRNQY